MEQELVAEGLKQNSPPQLTRRDVLQSAIAGGVAFAASRVLAEEQQSVDDLLHQLTSDQQGKRMTVQRALEEQIRKANGESWEDFHYWHAILNPSKKSPHNERLEQDGGYKEGRGALLQLLYRKYNHLLFQQEPLTTPDQFIGTSVPFKDVLRAWQQQTGVKVLFSSPTGESVAQFRELEDSPVICPFDGNLPWKALIESLDQVSPNIRVMRQASSDTSHTLLLELRNGPVYKQSNGLQMCQVIPFKNGSHYYDGGTMQAELRFLAFPGYAFVRTLAANAESTFTLSQVTDQGEFSLLTGQNDVFQVNDEQMNDPHSQSFLIRNLKGADKEHSVNLCALSKAWMQRNRKHQKYDEPRDEKVRAVFSFEDIDMTVKAAEVRE
jgi:hypothetical protein